MYRFVTHRFEMYHFVIVLFCNVPLCINTVGALQYAVFVSPCEAQKMEKEVPGVAGEILLKRNEVPGIAAEASGILHQPTL